MWLLVLVPFLFSEAWDTEEGRQHLPSCAADGKVSVQLSYLGAACPMYPVSSGCNSSHACWWWQCWLTVCWNGLLLWMRPELNWLSLWTAIKWWSCKRFASVHQYEQWNPVEIFDLSLVLKICGHCCCNADFTNISGTELHHLPLMSRTVHTVALSCCV